MSRKAVFFYCLCASISLALLHPSEYAPIICYGIVMGSGLGLLMHWFAEAKL